MALLQLSSCGDIRARFKREQGTADDCYFVQRKWNSTEETAPRRVSEVEAGIRDFVRNDIAICAAPAPARWRARGLRWSEHGGHRHSVNSADPARRPGTASWVENPRN